MSKKDIVKYIIDEYGVTSPTDITNALKDLLGETLQDMLNSEFDEHMGYDKYDQKTDKTNYRNGTSKKTVKTSQGNLISRLCFSIITGSNDEFLSLGISKSILIIK